MRTQQPGDRAVAIIIRDAHVLLIHRHRPAHDYYVLPGGSIEPGETAAAACVREVAEETGLRTALPPLIWQYCNHGRMEYYFLVLDTTGPVRLDSSERTRHAPDNCYDLVWIAENDLETHTLLPHAARAVCQSLLRQQTEEFGCSQRKAALET